jgi:uncharacterized membrane protein YeaQ/YmgE (transglycosylase-associated protein family)
LERLATLTRCFKRAADGGLLWRELEDSIEGEPDRPLCTTAEAELVSLNQFVVWIIVGLVGGSIAGLIIRRERRGFGVRRNLGLGLVGALVGGFLFWLLGLFPGLDTVRISLRDVVAAIVGSFLVLGALWLWQRWKGQS